MQTVTEKSDRSDLNREPKDYESVSGQGPTVVAANGCDNRGFQVAPKVALATAENACKLVTTVDDSDRQDSPIAVPIDPELARVISSWPGLPVHVKAAVMALVETSSR